MSEKKLRFETLQIHGGYAPDSTLSRGLAIYPTAAYHFKTCDYAANLFELSEPGNIYTRIHNPTTANYENRVAALYGGVGALATSSGMSSILLTVTALAKAGDNIVTSPYVYGGTHNQFSISLRNLDIEALAKVAHSHQMPLVVDNTFGACGYLCNPFEWGADIICDSATKWINGHGTAMGGIIVDGGTFDWGNGRYPEIDGPSEGYHGLNLWKTFSNQAFIVKCRVDGLRDFGCCPSPFDTYLMMLGLETLSLRVRHEAEATAKLAEFFRANENVRSVSYVGFEENPSYELAQKYFRKGAACVISVDMKGTLESTVKLVEGLKLVANMTMIGDSITVVTHPASTTHKQLSLEALERAGISPTLLRISAGLEAVEDIIEDFEQAFANI